MPTPVLSDSEALELVRRGLHTELPADRLEQRMKTGPLRVKLGLDPTASRVHLGWAVVLRKLRHFQEAGHTAVLVVGDYTARIGDPTGKSATRKRLTAEQVKEYSEQCLARVTPLLLQDRLEIRYNSEWLENFAFDEVLGLISKATVSQILERDDFSKRFKESRPISMVEFIYPLLQAYDSVQLKADIELGGSDQLFNNLMGRTIQEAYGQQSQLVCTVPLLVGLDGKDKMSQSLGNDVAVDEAPDDMFGKLMSIPDTAIVDYCTLAAWMPKSELDPIATGLASGELNPMAAKRAMAGAVVDLYHGPGAGTGAEAAFDRVHVHRQEPEEMPVRTISSVYGEESEITLATLIAALFSVSKKEARRLIDQGGIRLDGEPEPADRPVSATELHGVTVQRGRRMFVKMTAESS
ncbi:tyrosine--tRNA ligase [Nocardia sp. CA-128927]|uniref:tyrosine--tRNA ligase n=1 Tax=Nocardia sp. CA-128927 TaxID=3239975 RepID=UPI003D9546D8